MPHTRRSFVHTALFATCGLAAAPLAGWSAVTKRAFTFAETEQAVLDFTHPYAQQVRLLGYGVLLKLHHRPASAASFLVSASDPSGLQAGLNSPLPFANVRATANTLSCTLGATDVTIENVLPETFTARLATMAKPAGNVFDYDALSYDPATEQLVDPFSVATSGVATLVNPTLAGAQALDALLRGVAERIVSQVGASPSLGAWQSRILNCATPAASAQAIAGVFLRQLATLAPLIPAASMIGLLRTRAISSALKQVFGTNSATLPAIFVKVRKDFPTASEAALWFALLLGPELESNPTDGAATTWIQGGTTFQVLRSRAALKEAQLLVQDPNFPKV